MCRHIAYIGGPVALDEILFAPPYGLLRVSWQPREQRHGTVNADGFGIGWWAGDPARAVRYRRETPIWSDPDVVELAQVTVATAFVGAVRSATLGTAGGVDAAAPFTDRRLLFSHNGRIEHWPDAVDSLVRGVATAELLSISARTDSALLWLLVRRAVNAGLSIEKALASVVLQAAEASPGRYNFILHDGEQIAASAYGDTLYHRAGTTGVIVASEPTDDSTDWESVPDRHLVITNGNRVDVLPLEAVAS